MSTLRNLHIDEETVGHPLALQPKTLGPVMIGPYLRMVDAPHIMGTVRAARFDRGHAEFLFQADPRLADPFRQIWLPSSALEKCARPSDEEIAAINKKQRSRHLDATITDAIVSHRLWRIRFTSALESGFDFPEPEIVEAADQCALANWLKATQIPREIRESSEFNNVVELHRNFHRVAALVLSFAREGKHKQFRDALEPDGIFGQASSVLVDALEELRKTHRSF